MDTKKAYDKFYNLLLTKGELKIDNDLFNILKQYIDARLIDLGVNIPINFFFRGERLIQKENSSFYSIFRFNPITGEICKEKWKYGTRAFTNSKGIFIDFNIMNNLHQKKLDGYFMVKQLIDFAFTLEHELRHVVQFDNLERGITTYDNIQISKDLIVISYTQNQQDTLNRCFYQNAHNNMFLELDANEHATNFITSQIKSRKISQEKVQTFKNREYTISDILNDRIKESHFGLDKVDYMLNMIFGFDDSSHSLKLELHPQKIIDLLVDSLVRKKPIEYLNEFSVLRRVYNDDGTKKTYYEIKKCIELEPELYNFYQQIIDNDNLLKLQQMEDKMIEKYCDSSNKSQQTEILNNYIDRINSMLENENIDLDNILVYLDKRMFEIQTAELSDKYRSTAKIIAILTKQILLKKDYINESYMKTAIFKENVKKYRIMLEEKCGFNFSLEFDDRDNMLKELDDLIIKLQYDYAYKIYSSKGYSKKDINELLLAAKMCRIFYSKKGYILNDHINDKTTTKSLFDGFDNLYQTDYYKMKLNQLQSNQEELVKFKDEFALINEIYKESQRLVGLTGVDRSNSVAMINKENPLISKLLETNSQILNILHDIRNTENKTGFMTRLDAAIIVCESYLNEQTKTK